MKPNEQPGIEAAAQEIDNWCEATIASDSDHQA
jgi:hypothetical protein